MYKKANIDKKAISRLLGSIPNVHCVPVGIPEKDPLPVPTCIKKLIKNT